MAEPQEQRQKICADCGDSIPVDAPGGFCPGCALTSGLAVGSPLPSPAPPRGAATWKIRYFGDYELLREIARGGMGVVYQARQASLNRIVAVKMILAARLATAAYVERFRTGARTAARLRHSGIVSVHEAGEHEGQHYFAMDFVEGRSLAELTQGGPLPSAQAARYMRDTAEAVAYAHAQGVLHRDLKPSNILIDQEDQPRVTDFGLAKRLGMRQSSGALDETTKSTDTPDNPAAQSDCEKESGRGLPHSKTSRTSEPLASTFDSQLHRASKPGEDGSTQDPLNSLTLSGQILGSPNFMPPEQASGLRGTLTAASDVYSLGAVLYHLLTARPPFVAETLGDTLHQVANADPLPPRALNPSIPRDLETICLKCLEKEPAKRYTTAQALADELGRFLHDEPIHARPVGRIEKAWRWCRRKPALAGLWAAGFLLLVAVFTGLSLAALRNAAVRKAEQREYFAGITLADNYVRIGDIQRALDVLTNCPPRFRHWEWGRLMHLCHQEITTIHTVTNLKMAIVGGIDHTRIIVNPDQTRLVTVGEDGAATVWDLRTGSTGSLPVPSGNLPKGMAKASQPPTAGSARAAPPVVPVGGPPTGAGESPALPILQTSSRLFSAGGSTNRIIDMAFAPDGRQLALLGNAGLVEVWDAAESRRLFGIAVSNGPVRNVTFNSDGTHIRVTTPDSASIWDSETGQFLANTAPAPPPDRGSPHPHRVEVADAPEKVPTPSTPPRAAATESRGPVKFHRLALDPTGGRLATVDARSKVQLWDAETGELRHTLDGRFSDDARMFFSPNGRRLLVADPSAAPSTVWNTESGQQLISLLTRVDSAAFNADGSRVATVSGDNIARVWSANSGREILPLKGHAAIVRFIAFNSDSRFITTASEDGAVKIWRAELGREYNKTGSVIEGLDFSPDGKRLAVAHDEHIATVWDVESGRHLLSLEGHLHRVGRVAFSADGKRLVTSSYDKTVRTWDADTGRLQLTLRGHSNLIYGVAISPDGRYVASCGDRIRVWNITAGGEPRVLRGDNEFYIMSLAFRPDGKQLASGGGDGRVILWNHETGERQRALDNHTERVWSVAYRPDGRMLATAGFDRIIHLWDPNSGKLLRTLRGHFNIYSANFSPDGKRLVATTGEHFQNFGQGSAQVWDVETGRELMALEGHTSTLGFAAFSPDGQRIATADWNGLVRVWESFPWREQDYPGASDLAITQRAGLFARDYWKQRLAVDVVDSRPGNRALFTRSPRIDRSEFPARATNVPPNLIDLTEHYNALLNVSWFPSHTLALLAADLSSLPSATVSFAGIPFDVRGVIQLRAPSNNWLESGVPNLRQSAERVEGIRVGEKFTRLHALMGAVGKEPDGTPVGAFILHYADGRQSELPINYGDHVRDWWTGADASEAIRNGTLVWRGTNHLTRALGGEVRVFVSTFANPRPDVPVERVDFVSKLTGSGPFLIALTVEP